MILWILSLLLASGVAADCGDSTQVEAPDAYGYTTVTPDAAPEDSCAWEAPRVQNPELENTPDRERSRASLSMSQIPDAPVKSLFRDHAESHGWSSRVELREDTLTRRQLGWNGNGWRLFAGDVTDTTLPFWPRWLPRRTLPNGWNAAAESDALFPNTPVPQGFGAGMTSAGWNAYAVSAWDPVQGGGVPPWEKPWELRHFAAGAAAEFVWTPSLYFSETRVSRSGVDSMAEEEIALGLASPQHRLALNGVWSSSRQNPDGGFALGAKWIQPLADSARLEITLRQRSADWASSWDPTYSPDAVKDSNTVTGAGEGLASLRLPFQTHGGKGLMTGEGWAAWNPRAETRNGGVRGEVEWHRNDVRLETRGMLRQWTTATGYTGFHNFLAMETRLGRHPEWRAGVYEIWETTSSRQGLSLAVDARWRRLQVRPGMSFESDKDSQLSSSASLWLQWKMGGGWKLEADGSAPCGPDPAWSQARWRTTLNYSQR